MTSPTFEVPSDTCYFRVDAAMYALSGAGIWHTELQVNIEGAGASTFTSLGYYNATSTAQRTGNGSVVIPNNTAAGGLDYGAGDSIVFSIVQTEFVAGNFFNDCNNTGAPCYLSVEMVCP
jgi:hypothetical protein